MSEPVGQVGMGQNPAPDTAASAIEAGHLLRQAREATGLHVAALAVSLKVPVNKLEALEAGRIDLLPDLTFARALAASVCRSLKIDPTPVLAHFPATGMSRLGAVAPSVNTPYRPAGSGPRLSFRTQMLSPSVLAVVALLVAAVAVVLWPKSPDGNAEAVLAPGAEATESVAAPLPMAVVSEPVSAVLPVEPVVVPAAVPVPVAQAVVLTAQADSWVKVTDAKGVVGVGRTLKAGETVEVTGSFPMAVVVGRVDAVQLQVRGQPYDMAAFPKDRVARFEVK